MSSSNLPEVSQALEESRHELTLTGSDITKKIKVHGLDKRIFQISTLNFLEINGVELEVLPDELGNLSNMKNLVVRENKLKDLPTSLGSLNSLKFLDFSNNIIVNIPDTIRNLAELQSLNLSCNNLESFPNFDSLVALAILHIDHNKVDSLPEGIYNLPHLAQIHASGNVINEIKMEVSEMPALKLLDISNNSLNEVPIELSDCIKLKDLNLRDNPLKDNRLKKMTTQCNTKSVLDYIRQRGEGKSKGKKGKKKKKDKEVPDSTVDTSLQRKIHVIHNHEDDLKVIYKVAMKDVRPFIVCTIVRNLDLSDIHMFKKFLAIQTKLHENDCKMRTAATIATHNMSTLNFPLEYDAKLPNELKICPLGKNEEVPSSKLVNDLLKEREQEKQKKKRQQSSGLYRFLDLLDGKEYYPCLLSNEEVVSFPPITNSEKTKISASILDVFVEITSSVSLSACKSIMDIFIRQIFENGFQSSQYGDGEQESQVKHMTGLVVEQMRIADEDGGLRVVYPSKLDLQFDDIAVVQKD